jgi:hypothetical protein
MDAEKVQRAARILYRYKFAKNFWYRKAEFCEPIQFYDDKIKRGTVAFDDEIVIDPNSASIITQDGIDTDFLDAVVNGNDNALEISADKLDRLRRFVLHDEPLWGPSAHEAPQNPDQDVPIDTTLPELAEAEQSVAQAPSGWRRFWNRSPRG